MPHILKNNKLEVYIDLPTENYKLSRFDWTGKIVAVLFNGKYLSGIEIADSAEEMLCGKGFYNEFGIASPLGFDETEIGGWFHKIGIGLLKKAAASYDFNKVYEVAPAKFEVVAEPDSIQIKCESQHVNGYAYVLEKEIRILDSGFEISYHLENKGEKAILTNEYNHNFLSIDRDPVGRVYTLKFPFPIRSELFGESINPEQIVNIGPREITFYGTPKEPFFFSNLSGSEMVDAKWELENARSKIGISETGSFQTNRVNLWGWGHVISPELFFDLNVEAGQSMEWSRAYHVYEID